MRKLVNLNEGTGPTGVFGWECRCGQMSIAKKGGFWCGSWNWRNFVWPVEIGRCQRLPVISYIAIHVRNLVKQLLFRDVV